jgi:hypothetical protein
VKRIVLVVAAAMSLAVAVPATAFAGNPSGTGQPSQTCGEGLASSTPSSATASAPGSAFNPDGKAGMVYAGTQSQNSKNPVSVSQYDVACFQTSTH